MTTDKQRIYRAVVFSQILFTAGHSLTTGAFFNYFVYGFQPSAFVFAVLQILPESAESLSWLTRWLLMVDGSRKRLWIAGVLIGRVCALGVPLALFLKDQQLALVLIMIATSLWYLCQGIAYVSYLSWLSDLVPETNWGEFFARRQIAMVVISMLVPISAGLMRSYYLQELNPSWQRWSYLLVFFTGAIVVVTSILPMLGIPDVGGELKAQRHWFAGCRQLIADSNFRWFIASRWWLAFFQGLTQSVLFFFKVQYLKLSLEASYGLLALMLLLQITLTQLGGFLSDHGKDRSGFGWGIVISATGMFFLFLATPEQWWWIIGTYVAWGAFGVVNLCGRNLCLKLAPLSDNTAQMTLYRQFSGLVAGLAGLWGGWWLGQLRPEGSVRLWPFYLLFAISIIGRSTAPLWLLLIKRVNHPHTT